MASLGRHVDRDTSMHNNNLRYVGLGEESDGAARPARAARAPDPVNV